MGFWCIFGKRGLKKLTNFIFWSIFIIEVYFYFGRLAHTFFGRCLLRVSFVRLHHFFPRWLSQVQDQVRFIVRRRSSRCDCLLCWPIRTRRLLVWDFSAMQAVTEKLIDKETVKRHQIRITPSIYYLGNIAVLGWYLLGQFPPVSQISGVRVSLTVSKNDDDSS